MKPLVIYHANCADGFGAAFAAWTVLGDDAEYVACQYGEQTDTWMEQHNAEVTSRDVYILDFSFPRHLMERIFKSATRVVWLDHHATSKFDMASFTNIGANTTRLAAGLGPVAWPHTVIHSDNKSGAVLAWEYFHPGTEVPMFIKHIDDYDRWQFKIDGTKAFNKALWSYAPWSFNQWKSEFMFERAYGRYNEFLMEGEAILRAHDQNVQSVVTGSARKCNIPVASVPTMWEMVANGISANCPPHLTSDVGHELANQSGTFGLCWTLGKTGSIAKCSLRSNGDYDVSAIAKSFGGGGHRNAAGFEVDIQALLGWLK